MFPETGLPFSVLFHASDTVREIKSFPAFEKAFREERAQILVQAEIELWLATRHYMYRYGKLRGAIFAFRGAAIIFLCVLTASVIANLLIRF